MKTTLIAPPAAEPLSLAEAKLFLRLDSSAEDATVLAVIAAARQAVEAATRLKLISQGWRVTLDAWPPDRLVTLPVAPVLSVDAVRVFDAAGSAASLAATAWQADLAGRTPRLRVPQPPAPGRPLAGIEIDVTAGFGPASAVPEALRHAVRLVAARLFEERGDGEARPMPPEAAALMAPYRRLGL